MNEPNEHRSAAIAFLITFRTYGSWLPGDARGSVNRAHNKYDSPLVEPNAAIENSAQHQMRQTAILLAGAEQEVVDQSIRRVAHHRSWTIRCLNVRSNHVHVVVEADAKPEKVMNDFKVWSTRGLRDRGLISLHDKVWARHGSTRYLWKESEVEKAIEYVVDGQGDLLT